MDSWLRASTSRVQVNYFLSFFFGKTKKKFVFFFRKDSIVSERINYDLLKKAKDIQEGIVSCPELLGTSNNTKTTDTIPAAIEKHLRGKACK